MAVLVSTIYTLGSSADNSNSIPSLIDIHDRLQSSYVSDKMSAKQHGNRQGHYGPLANMSVGCLHAGPCVQVDVLKRALPCKAVCHMQDRVPSLMSRELADLSQVSMTTF